MVGGERRENGGPGLSYEAAVSEVAGRRQGLHGQDFHGLRRQLPVAARSIIFFGTRQQ